MERKESPLFYARAAIETMMRRFPGELLPPEGRFHYHQGVFLSGVLQTAALLDSHPTLTGSTAEINLRTETGAEADTGSRTKTGAAAKNGSRMDAGAETKTLSPDIMRERDFSQRCWQYASDWIHAVFSPEGEILHYDHADLDDIQPGILLYPLMDHFPEEASFYQSCLKSVEAQIADIPRCKCGGFYHKVRCTRQMWLDGLYMACPFITEYARRFDRPDLRDLAVQEILLMQQHTRDPKTGLWYHGWDESHEAYWADPKTGLAPEFWGRSMGWVPIAVLDVLDQLSENDPDRETLIRLVQDLLQSLCKYQSPDGRWYQVVDKGGQPGNWLENSCSCLYASAIARSVRLGILKPDYMENAWNAFDSVTDDLTWDGDDLRIGNVCIGTGIGDYDFYCHRPVCVNDLHGVGAFLLMCVETQKCISPAGHSGHDKRN